VEPTKDEYRATLHHPNGAKFPASGSAEWPHDRFTNRRIADGSVKVVGEHAREHRRHRSAEAAGA